MKKCRNTILALVMSSVLFIGTSCGEIDNKPNEIELFGSPITEKILQDVEANSSQKTVAEFAITSAKGETEDAQIISKERQISNMNLGNEYIIERETHWKEVLLTRRFGLNKN